MTAPRRAGLGLDPATFLARVRRGLGLVAPSAPPAPPAIPDELVRLVDPRDNAAEIFCRRATAVGMNVGHATVATLRDALLALLPDRRGAPAVLEVGDTRLFALARDALAARGAVILEPRPAQTFEPLFDAAIGISDVDAALADSGSLVRSTSALRGRGVSVVPPMHIALVQASRILPDLLDWARNPGGSNSSSHTVLITGPSKTADIEGVLITGVHGPGAVHVIVISDA